jgi:hypothetical protein
MTDSDGQFTASLQNSTLYAVTTGLKAISFDPLLDTGAALAARSPVTIEAKRLITSPEDPCRILIDGVPNVYFSSTNVTDDLLSVPLAYTTLNQMLSTTGGATPPEDFAPGTSGFSIRESHFRSGTTLMGVWKFLGQEITIRSDIQFCSDRGVPGQCAEIDPTILRTPLEYTRTTILKLTNLSLAAARTGRWKGSNGRFSVPFLARGATALASMERIVQNLSGKNFQCAVVPMACSVQRVPKKDLEKAFAKIFAGRVPKGLAHISKRSTQEKSAFARILKKIPDTYVRCE